MRSLIVEGCDGSGKDTLIAQLRHMFPGYRLHDRASTSLGGPVASLDQWVTHDAETMHREGPWIYNRHPLISEPIYAQWRKVNPGLSGNFRYPEWIAEWRRIVGNGSIVVICQPPYNVVRSIVTAQGSDAHMPGVAENIRNIYMAYNRLVWPGPTIRYDRTLSTFPDLVNILNRVQREI